ncbi:DUF2269 domain-containing protein [Paraburkholderia sp. DHOC27]|uniref:DUF2269 family protein n=1 Tax=Paraburkholderia sp. DHOC27 TaxID=2303330 RepID=UPI000E3D2629|nr:DUF2269 domain-containing protein [Paraburkholderia sp. DHOC27]RFU44390.1 DUF2269 domain-containing protein [Paraburkholderia sp. DHOC27]
MNLYLAIKTLHILSSVLLVGTGFGSAFYLYFAHRTRSIAVIAPVTRLVVRADWWFTTPAGLFQPLSGFWLAHAAGWAWKSPWIVAAVVLYGVAGMCWLPVVWLQIELTKMARVASESHLTELPERYWRFAKLWERLGYPAFLAMAMIYFLMVFKPA